MLDIEETLQDAGLSEKESRVYLSLLEFGQGTAYDIARRSGYTRATVYDVFDALEDKHLITKFPANKRQVVAVQDPQILVDQLRGKLENLETILPYLHAISGRKHETDLAYFDGRKGYLASVSNTIELQKGKEVLNFYAHSPDFVPKDFIETVQNKWRTMGEAGTKMKAIIPEHGSALEYFKQFVDEYGWEVRSAPLDKYSSLVSFTIVDDYVIMHSRQKEQHVVIRNADAAHAQRQIFQMVWESLKKENEK